MDQVNEWMDDADKQILSFDVNMAPEDATKLQEKIEVQKYSPKAA